MFSFMYDDDDDSKKYDDNVEFVVKLVEVPLFFTVEYMITIHVGDELFKSSDTTKTRPTQEHVNEWVRGVILKYKSVLTELNVPVISTYTKFGGDAWEIMN